MNHCPNMISGWPKARCIISRNHELKKKERKQNTWAARIATKPRQNISIVECTEAKAVAMDGLEESSSKAAEAVLEILRTRGWSLGGIDQLNALIIIHSALSDDGDPCTVANAVESELLNMDLRSIGLKSLPDPNLLNKTSYLQGPKILQVIYLFPRFIFIEFQIIFLICFSSLLF